MIKSIFAYISVFLLAPTLGGLAGLLLTFLSFPLMAKLKTLIPLLGGAISIVIGFVSVWVGAVVFSWFNKQPTLLMIIVLGVGFGFNDFRRILHTIPLGDSAGRAGRLVFLNEISGTIGNLLGIIAGGIYFL